MPPPSHCRFAMWRLSHGPVTSGPGRRRTARAGHSATGEAGEGRAGPQVVQEPDPRALEQRLAEHRRAAAGWWCGPCRRTRRTGTGAAPVGRRTPACRRQTAAAAQVGGPASAARAGAGGAPRAAVRLARLRLHDRGFYSPTVAPCYRRSPIRGDTALERPDRPTRRGRSRAGRSGGAVTGPRPPPWIASSRRTSPGSTSRGRWRRERTAPARPRPPFRRRSAARGLSRLSRISPSAAWAAGFRRLSFSRRRGVGIPGGGRAEAGGAARPGPAPVPHEELNRRAGRGHGPRLRRPAHRLTGRGGGGSAA
jgi:hypothetical protein